MTINFSSNHYPHRSTSHKHPSKAVGRNASTSLPEQGMSSRSKLKIALVAAPLAIFSWIGHFGSHSLLANQIKSKDPTVSVFEGKNKKLEKLKDALNKGFEPDTSLRPYHRDTVFIPDNITPKSQSGFVQNFKALFVTPPLDKEEIHSKLLKIEDNRRYQNPEQEVPALFELRVGDGVFFDENGGKYLPIKYYAKDDK